MSSTNLLWKSGATQPAVINSSEGTEMLPTTYTNNDFDGLFDELFEPNPSVSAPNSTYPNNTKSNNNSENITNGVVNTDAEEFQRLLQHKVLDAVLCLQKVNQRQRQRMRTANSTSVPLLVKVGSRRQDRNNLSNLHTVLEENDIDFVAGQNHYSISNASASGFQSSNASSSLSNDRQCVTTPLVSKLFTSDPKSEVSSTAISSITSKSSTSLSLAAVDVASLSNKKRKITAISLSNQCNEDKNFQSIQNKKSKNSIQSAMTTLPSKNMILPHVSNYRQESPAPAESTHIDSTQKNPSTFQYVKVVASELPSKAKENKVDKLDCNSPLATYLQILRSRSYDTRQFQTMTRYCSKPSRLQLASFGKEVIKAVDQRDAIQLKALIQTGLSPNPCNQFGDSIFNTICKRGHEDLFNALLECGASIQTCDFFGRTPLHFVCWSSKICFGNVEKVMASDSTMFNAVDKVGKSPLEYIGRDKWEEWNAFLLEKQDIFWPKGKELNLPEVVILEGEVLADPSSALSEEHAKLVASGQKDKLKGSVGNIDFYKKVPKQ